MRLAPSTSRVARPVSKLQTEDREREKEPSPLRSNFLNHQLKRAGALRRRVRRIPTPLILMLYSIARVPRLSSTEFPVTHRWPVENRFVEYYYEESEQGQGLQQEQEQQWIRSFFLQVMGQSCALLIRYEA